MVNERPINCEFTGRFLDSLCGGGVGRFWMVCAVELKKQIREAK